MSALTRYFPDEIDVARDDFVVAHALPLDFLDVPAPLDCMSRNEASNVSSEWRMCFDFDVALP